MEKQHTKHANDEHTKQNPPQDDVYAPGEQRTDTE